MSNEVHSKEWAIKCDEIIDLMFCHEISMKDLSIRIDERAAHQYADLAEVQRKIKGFLYPDQNIVEP